jgi:nucleoside-triphosphatase THEP1
MNNFFLLSGPIHTGKTTLLTKWIKNKTSVDGILQPIINGKRHIKLISSGEVRLLEMPPDSMEQNILSIGKYKFSSECLIWASDHLILSFYQNPEWLIIDEFGKLEMDNKGMEPTISKIFTDLEFHPKIKLVFVVRDYLVSSFLNKYSLSKNDILNLEL